MSAYWVNFAKTGNPNGKGLPIWDSYNKEGGRLLTFETDAIEMNSEYSQEFQFLSQD